MSIETNRTIVITDFARGDDQAAGTFVLGSASSSRQETSFVATYGNRSTSVCFQNLKQTIPVINSRLRNPFSLVPEVYYGADRPIGQRRRYRLTPERIEYLIHGNMGNDDHHKPYIRSFERSRVLYNRLSGNEDNKISILSLGATSELPPAIRNLSNRLKVIFLMGGVLNLQGNTDPDQEANFRHDHTATMQAFKLAQENSIPIVVIPLDASEQEGVLFNADRLKYLADRLRGKYGMKVLDQTAGPDSVYGGFYLGQTYHRPDFPYEEVRYAGVPLHDVTAAVVQQDYQSGGNIFSYVGKRVKPNKLGQVGIARDYMLPNFPTIIAGPLVNYDDFWRRLVERFNEYR